MFLLVVRISVLSVLYYTTHCTVCEYTLSRFILPLHCVLLNDIGTKDLLGFAAVLLLLLPPLLIFLFFEDEVIEGLKEYRLK